MLLAVYLKTFFSADIAAFCEITICDFTERIYRTKIIGDIDYANGIKYYQYTSV